ncbi:MAG TPA: methyltransferase domain-containing protein [Dehalococcoidales bacterium]|nr:methyltransferase domain-containing protein [Dehalococcoidales bacterium]
MPAMTHSHDASTEPASFLMENIGLLPVGKALDVAMGNGRNAIYLAGAGFTVTGIDISAETVAAAREAARRAGVTLTAKVADLEGGYRIEKNAYDVIICFNYLQRSLVPAMKKGVRPGGMVVYETFIIDQAQFGRPRNPDFLLRHNELLEMFRDFRCLRYREGIIEDRKAVAGIVAQKV